MHYLLHIDTSTDTGTIAIAGDGLVLSVRTNTESRNHAATINIMIEEVLTEAGISMQVLSAIVVCAGPGSYTGLRIGLATAKGICYALNLPLLLNNRLTLLSYQASKKAPETYTNYIALLLAREKEYFIAAYDNDFNCTIEPQHITEDQLTDIINTTHRTLLITDVINNNILLNVPDLTIDTATKLDLIPWAYYAFSEFKCNNIVNLSTAEPFYLKQAYTHK